MGPRTWSAAAVALLAGCLDIPPPPQTCDQPGADTDGDGWTCDNPKAPDCDDHDPDRNPGGFDVPADGIDQNCFGGDRDPNESAPEILVAGNDVHTGPYTMRFDSGPTRLPLEMTLTGFFHDQLLYSSSAPDCPIDREELFGVSMFPAFAAHANTISEAGGGTLLVAASGHAMGRIHVAIHSASIVCPTDKDIDIDVDFTFFPDGRLIRHDQIMPPMLNPTDDCSTPSPCLDNIPSHFYFTSYLALIQDPFTHWQSTVPPQAMAFSPIPTTPASAQGDTTSGWHCMVNQPDGYGIGTTWPDGADAVGTRLRRGNDPFIASVVDIERPTTPIMNRMRRLDTAMFFLTGEAGSLDCSGMDALAASYNELAIGTRTVDRETGILTLDAEVPGQVSFGPNNTQITNAELPAGVALGIPSVQFQGVTVWRNGTRIESGKDYQVQSTPEGYVVWLPLGLAMSDTLVIALPGGEP